jgi:hypothetical protein
MGTSYLSIIVLGIRIFPIDFPKLRKFFNKYIQSQSKNDPDYEFIKGIMEDWSAFNTYNIGPYKLVYIIDGEGKDNYYLSIGMEETGSKTVAFKSPSDEEIREFNHFLKKRNIDGKFTQYLISYIGY